MWAVGSLDELPPAPADTRVQRPAVRNILSQRIELNLTAATLATALVLGGATHSGFLSDAVLQLIAAPLLVVLGMRAASNGMSRNAALVVFAALLVLAVGAMQLVPLPPAVWVQLPGRAALAQIQDALPTAGAWRPASLTPEQTRLALLSGLPPLAVLIGTLQLDHHERRRSSVVIIVVGLASALLGIVQALLDPAGPFHLFGSLNGDGAVGFFANRNHFAALLYCAVPLSAAWAIDNSRSGPHSVRPGRDDKRLAAPVASVASICVLAAVQPLAQSRAGIALMMAAVAGAAAMVLLARGRQSDKKEMLPLLLTLGALMVIGAQAASYVLLQRSGGDPLADARLTFARNTVRLALDYMPFGAGLGSFVPVYARHEPMADALANTFANHAHNDFLELWLEIGVFALASVTLYLAWLARQAWRVWLMPERHVRDIDRSLARAATLVVALLLAHSLVDYPLRTSAMMCVFAWATAMLVAPQAAASQHRTEGAGAGHGLEGRPPPGAEKVITHERSHPETPRQPAVEKKRPPAGERWGGDVDWPEAWRRDADSPNHRTDQPQEARTKKTDQ